MDGLKSEPLKLDPLKPSRLKPGDTLAIISPSAPTPVVAGQPDPFESGTQLLTSLGFNVKIMPHARRAEHYLAGSDNERLSDLHAAFEDPAIHGILCARGGYGAARLLDNINFNLIAENPKLFIGFSDITVLQLAFWKETGLTSFYGPMLTSNLIHQEPFSQQQLFSMLQGELDLSKPLPNLDTYQCFRSGVAEGPLLGGHLSLLVSLTGTSFQPDSRGSILFIEDWKEKYYTLDRQLQQLKMAGWFHGIEGLILCDFSEIEPLPNYPLTDLLKSLTADLTVPVGYGFSVGHGKETGTLAIGTRARFDAGSGELFLLEQPVV
jgi:muramoyltetrapeptide carboxypeptidase